MTGALASHALIDPLVARPTQSELACGPDSMFAFRVGNRVHLFQDDVSYAGSLRSESWTTNAIVQGIKWSSSRLLVLGVEHHSIILLEAQFGHAGHAEMKQTTLASGSDVRGAVIGGCTVNTWVVVHAGEQVNFYLLPHSGEPILVPTTVLIEQRLGKGDFTFTPIPNSCYVQIDSDSTTLVVHLEPKKQVPVYQGHKALSVSVSPSNKRIIVVYPARVVSTDGTVDTSTDTLYSIETGGVPVANAFASTTRESSLLLVTEDGNVHHIVDGVRVWTRYESLSSVRAAFLVDYPERKSWEDEEVGADLVTRWLDRWASHISSLVEVASRLANGNVIDITGSDARNFGFKKVIFLVTGSNALVGMDSETGAVLWTRYLSRELVGAKLLRPTTGSDPAVVLVSAHEGSWVIDPFTGKDAPSTAVTGNAIHDGKASDIKRPVVYKYRIRGTTMQGYQVSPKSNVYVSTFNLTLHGDRIVSIGIPHKTKVASAGRVMSDRSVKYKVLNGNILAIATQIDGTVLRVQLVDAANGRLVGHFAQPDVDFSQPIHILRVEHWALVVYWNQGHSGPAGWTASVIEMLEGDSEAIGQFGTLADLPPVLHVASFALPLRDTITSLSVSKTRNGVTVPDVLYTTSRSVGTISRRFLDALRASTSESDAGESGILPYSHMLPTGMDDRNLLSHERFVVSDKLLSKSTDLESTSVVCAYGFDVFCTRVTPSGTFDQLSDTFAKRTLIMTCIGLGVACVVANELVRRKQLNSQWK
ncbi:hypothetical protein BCR44DRAFT_50996 [Catenaria anguillulae PL171]|uniref:ER membrane protein complex subunit 1 n=1 Tax=Catenaria anguillulae PL171 TaxID=765915 RepID=A0A1Y2HHM6_9FUNG|nr:hypothetical protein BCR44DRAFT_50996 [Catenaria anguillulae PL171]